MVITLVPYSLHALRIGYIFKTCCANSLVHVHMPSLEAISLRSPQSSSYNFTMTEVESNQVPVRMKFAQL